MGYRYLAAPRLRRIELLAWACDPTNILEIIERFASIGEAEAAVTALDAGGIEVALFDDAFIGINWLYSSALGGIKVVVREEDYDAAADILDFPAEETAEEAEEAEAPLRAVKPHCPSCGLTTIAGIPKLRIFGCSPAASEVKDAETARTLHLLLRRHGQEVRKTSEPRCGLCPLRKMCD